MSTDAISMVKMCVGAEKVSDLYTRQNKMLENFQDSMTEAPIAHITRMRPKKEVQLLNGGSLYWVFKGHILARQSILSLNDIYFEDNVKRCEIKLDRRIMLTESKPKKPFQGWRYLENNECPRDLMLFSEGMDDLPKSLIVGLGQLGVL